MGNQLVYLWENGKGWAGGEGRERKSFRIVLDLEWNVLHYSVYGVSGWIFVRSVMMGGESEISLLSLESVRLLYASCFGGGGGGGVEYCMHVCK
jgi:hypothetical protein